MNEQDERYQLLKLHPCSRGLSDEALQEIADATELIRCAPGQCVHRAQEPINSVYLIIHGRLRINVVDMNGKSVLQRYQSTGDQFGGVAAAFAEPSPMECVAEDPSTLLRIDYHRGLELTKKYDVFRVNYTRVMAESIKRVVFNNRFPSPPQVAGFMHQSDQTRVVSQKTVSSVW